MTPSEPQRQVVIWGASGHAAVVAEIIRAVGEYEIAGFITDTPVASAPGIDPARIFDTRECLGTIRESGIALMIIAIGRNSARLDVAGLAQGAGFTFVTAVHPAAIVSTTSTVGPGSVIAAGSVIAPGATIGSHVIVNTGVSVDHENVIEDGVHLGPGAHLGGRVIVQKAALVAIGATIADRITIGSGAIVGAGAVVLHDVAPRTVVYGAPATAARMVRQGEN